MYAIFNWKPFLCYVTLKSQEKQRWWNFYYTLLFILVKLDIKSLLLHIKEDQHNFLEQINYDLHVCTGFYTM